MNKPLSLIPILVLSILFSIANKSCAPKPTVGEFEITISKELPTGSNEQQVMRFLDDRGISHSHLEPAKKSSGRSTDNDLDDKEFDDRRDRVERYIAAIVRDVDNGFFTNWSITLKFWFDKENRLIGYKVRKLGTSL